MFYPYKCLNCNKERIVEKDMKDAHKQETCEKCGKYMIRVFKLFGIRTGDGFKK